MTSTGAFWLGLILAIPLSIAANLLTPTLRTWFERTSKRRTIRRTKQAQEELERIRAFFADRQKYYEYLLGVVIKTTFIGAIVGAVVSLLYAAPALLPLISLNGAAIDIVRVEGPKKTTKELNSKGEEVVTEVSTTTETPIPRSQGSVWLLILMTGGAQLFALIGGLMVASIAGEGLRTIIRVSNFQSYERNVTADG